tara:strand:+ start:19191 stop:19484 length:294 start_codon:yes stop_codon:yes gene_type:complete
MSSRKKKYDSKRLQQIINQISGDIDPDAEEIFPTYIVKGTGYMWCYSPTAKTMVRILRGSKAYLLHDSLDDEAQAMVFVPYEIVKIDLEDLEEIGYN